MNLAEIGRRGQRLDPAHGGDVDAHGRLLSVAELQRALRIARTQAAEEAPPTAPPTPNEPALLQAPQRTTAPTAYRPVPVPGMRVAALAGHTGAGCSTVALAIADAATADGVVHLIDIASPRHSALAGASSRELGCDESGAWRRGTRNAVWIDRRAQEHPQRSWPSLDDAAAWTVVDYGAVEEAIEPAAGQVAVAVCRLTVPGITGMERLLASTTTPTLVAVVGAHRWPGQVTAAAGTHVQAARAAGRVFTVPIDHRLNLTGLGPDPLPKPVAAAGRRLLGGLRHLATTHYATPAKGHL